jgi:hypothetical protein
MMDSDNDGTDPMDLIGFGDVMDPSKLIDRMMEEDDDDYLGIQVWWDNELDLLSLIE